MTLEEGLAEGGPYHGWHKVGFYEQDEVYQTMFDAWDEFLPGVKGRHAVSHGSSSYTGHRYVTFVFEREEDAALFKLFFAP